MPRLTVINLTNSPFDLEGGHRLPAMGSVTADFPEHYAEVLRLSPGVEVRFPAPEDRLSDGQKAELLASAKPHPLDHDGDGRKGGSQRGRASTVAKGRRRKVRA